MSYERVNSDLYTNIDKKQFYPFSVGQVRNGTRTLHSCSLEQLLDTGGYIYDCITKDLGLTSCTVDIGNPVDNIEPSEEDLKDNIGVVLYFQNIEKLVHVTLKSRLDSKEFQIVLCRGIKQFIAFSSDFGYTIETEYTEPKIKFRFSFASKENYAPNPEVLSVVKYIEALTETPDSSISTVIYGPDVYDGKVQSYYMGMYSLHYFKEVYDFLQKVVYGVYLFNSKYDTPFLGAELFVNKKKYGKTKLPFEKKYLCGAIGDSITLWSKKNEPQIWDGASFKPDKGKNDRIGIHLVQPEVDAKHLLNTIKSLDVGTSKYQHCYNLIIKGLSMKNVEFARGNPSDYYISLFELTKSNPKQKDEIVEDFHSIGIKNLPVTIFDIDEIKCMEDIIGWSDLLEIFQVLSTAGFAWRTALYCSLYDLIQDESFKISKKDKESVIEFQNSIFRKLMKYLTRTFNSNFIESSGNTISSEQLMLENLLNILLKSNDKDLKLKAKIALDIVLKFKQNSLTRETLILISKKFNNLVETAFYKLAEDEQVNGLEEDIKYEPTKAFAKVSKLYASWYFDRHDCLKTYINTFTKVVEMFQQNTSDLTQIITNLNPKSISFRHFKVLAKYLTEKQLSAVMNIHFQLDSNKSFEEAMEEKTSTSKLFLKCYAKHSFDETKLLNIFKFLDYNDIEEILFNSKYLYQYSFYEDMEKKIGTERIISLMKDKTMLSFNDKLPNFIERKTLSDDKNLDDLELQYLNSHLRIISSAEGFQMRGQRRRYFPSMKNISKYIQLSLFTKDLDFIDTIIQESRKTCIKNLISISKPSSHVSLSIDTFNTSITDIFKNIISMSNTCPGYGIINGFRSICDGILETLSSFVNVPENNYEYLLCPRYGSSKFCNCPLCMKISNFLSSNDKTYIMRTLKKEVKHIQKEFYNDTVNYRIEYDEPLKELLTITIDPWRDRERITITKKPLIPLHFQPMRKIIPIIEELLGQIPSKPKSARKRIPLPSEEEPPKKIQKTN